MAHLQPLYPTVSVTAFNRGKASKIFSDVKKQGMTVVMKNNEPECILLSPHDYDALLDEICDRELLRIAEERLEEYDPKETISWEEVAKKGGIDLKSTPAEDIELE